MESVYLGYFGSKSDIATNFSIPECELDGCEILFAYYYNEDYEGNAIVIYQKDGKLYEVNGGHCSCYGLEEQWSPEETSFEAIAKRDWVDMSYGESVIKFLSDNGWHNALP